MVSASIAATVGFGVAAYYAPTSFLQNSMIVSSLLALSPLPVTFGFIVPTVKALKALEKSGDSVKATAEGDTLIEKWGKLSLFRWLLVAGGFLNGLYQLSEWYHL